MPHKQCGMFLPAPGPLHVLFLLLRMYFPRGLLYLSHLPICPGGSLHSLILSPHSRISTMSICL